MKITPSLVGLAAVLMTLALVGCTNSYKRIEGIGSELVLDRSVRAYVARPIDFIRDGEVYLDSGVMTAAVLRNNLSRHVAQAFLAPAPDHFTNSVAQAMQLSCQHLYVPVILNWADHQTRNSGRRDRVRIGITLYELPRTNVLHTAELRGKSRWYGSNERDVPEDLLLRLMQDYVLDLYQVPQPPPPAPDKLMLSTDPGF